MLEDERGQALSMAVILMIVATMVVSSVLIFTSTMLMGQRKSEDNVRALMAADAGIEAVMSDLIRGANPVTTTYPMPVVTANEYSPSITVTAPSAQATPQPTYQYIDPGFQDPNFATVPASSGYLIHLYNVQPSTATFTNVMQISWSYSPAGATRIGIWKDAISYMTAGQITQYPNEQPILDTGRSRGTDTYNQTNEIALDLTAGTYSIVFWNISGSTAKVTSPFKPSGGAVDTWIYTSAFADYMISSTVGGTTVDAYVRQTPGPLSPPVGDWSRSNTSFVTQTLTVQTMDRQ